jgi:hypothetical protein
MGYVWRERAMELVQRELGAAGRGRRELESWRTALEHGNMTPQDKWAVPTVPR